jgi:hypothetical protein
MDGGVGADLGVARRQAACGGEVQLVKVEQGGPRPLAAMRGIRRQR